MAERSSTSATRRDLGAYCNRSEPCYDPEPSVGFSSSSLGDWEARTAPFRRTSCERICSDDPDSSVRFSSSSLGDWEARTAPFRRTSCERICPDDPEGRWKVAGGEVSVANENHRFDINKGGTLKGCERRSLTICVLKCFKAHRLFHANPRCRICLSVQSY